MPLGQFGQRLLGASGRVRAGRTTRAQAHSDLELAELAGWAFFPHGALVGYPAPAVGSLRFGKFPFVLPVASRGSCGESTAAGGEAYH